MGSPDAVGVSGQAGAGAGAGHHGGLVEGILCRASGHQCLVCTSSSQCPWPLRLDLPLLPPPAPPAFPIPVLVHVHTPACDMLVSNSTGASRNGGSAGPEMGPSCFQAVSPCTLSVWTVPTESAVGPAWQGGSLGCGVWETSWHWPRSHLISAGAIRNAWCGISEGLRVLHEGPLLSTP